MATETPTIQTERLLTDAQTAEFLGVARQTLAKWRCNHRHDLPYIKVGTAIRYRESELWGWLRNRTVTNNAK